MRKGEVQPKKLEATAVLKEVLKEQENFVISEYKGIGIPAQSEVRDQIRQKKASFRVIKNSLFRIAMEDTTPSPEARESLKKDLKGPLVLAFSKSDLPSVSKILLDFGKKHNGLRVKSGYMDGSYLSLQDVKDISSLPTREELLTIIARGMNTPVTKIASGLNQLIASIARGVQEVAGKKE